jgi:soluble lytic murein transglycosylase-like protein
MLSGRTGWRAAVAGLAAGAALLAWAPVARAGAQIEEPLADSVRSALSAAIAQSAPPPELKFDNIDQRLAYLRWLGAMSERLKKSKSEGHERIEFLQTVWYESRRAGLEPALVLGLVQVESGFRKYAISSVGARGYTQVMPFWSRQIGDGDAARLFVMQVNLRFGCVILRHYLDVEKGDLFMALGRYNGSRGQAAYPDMVLGARKRWEWAEPRAAASAPTGPASGAAQLPARPASR